MELKKLSEHIWYMPFEEERDRPNLGGCSVRLLQTPAPHTDDSTLVYVCEDKTLFVGDAACAGFPNGVKDRKLAGELADKIRSTGAAVCVEGHWQPVPAEDTLADLML